MSLPEGIRQLGDVVASLDARADVASLDVIGLDRCVDGISASVTIDVVTDEAEEGPGHQTTGVRAEETSERPDPLADWSPAAVPRPAVETAVETAESVPELADRLGLATDQALWALGYYDLGSAVPAAGTVTHDASDGATDGELSPDDPGGEPPGSLTEADVVAVANRYDTLEAVAADFEVGTDRAAAVLEAHDCAGEVTR